MTAETQGPEVAEVPLPEGTSLDHRHGGSGPLERRIKEQMPEGLRGRPAGRALLWAPSACGRQTAQLCGTLGALAGPSYFS